MSKIFESNNDLKREEKAIKIFCEKFSAKWEKLGKYDVDYKVTINEKICYIEVKGRNRNIKEAYPLPLAARKMVKLVDMGKPSIIIWACLDGLIYGKTSNIFAKGIIGGRKPRSGSSNDKEYMLYFEKQKNLFNISIQKTKILKK